MHFPSSSARLKARIAGLLYLLVFVIGPSGASSATPTNVIGMLACDVGVALILYVLLKPVGRRMALLGAVFRLICVAILAVNSLNYFGVLDLFHAAHSAAAFNTGYAIALVPFGIQCLLFGYLIFKSGFLPRILGILFALAGLGYLICVWPPLGQRLFFPYIVIPGVIGEGALTLWLLIFGVNVKQWDERACASPQGG